MFLLPISNNFSIILYLVLAVSHFLCHFTICIKVSSQARVAPSALGRPGGEITDKHTRGSAACRGDTDRRGRQRAGLIKPYLPVLPVVFPFSGFQSRFFAFDGYAALIQNYTILYYLKRYIQQ